MWNTIPSVFFRKQKGVCFVLFAKFLRAKPICLKDSFMQFVYLLCGDIYMRLQARRHQNAITVNMLEVIAIFKASVETPIVKCIGTNNTLRLFVSCTTSFLHTVFSAFRQRRTRSYFTKFSSPASSIETNISVLSQFQTLDYYGCKSFLIDPNRSMYISTSICSAQMLLISLRNSFSWWWRDEDVGIRQFDVGTQGLHISDFCTAVSM